MWNIYYHMYLDKMSLDLLRSQSKKLYGLSATIDSWRQSEYGTRLDVCDSATLTDVRKLWEFYSVEHKGTEVSHLKRRLESMVQMARNEKDKKAPGSIGLILTGFRSAAPAHIGALGDLDTLHKHYWKHGSTDFNATTRASAKHPNPMFLTLEDEATLHYGVDPFLGFHLAIAYAPLHPNSPLFNEVEDRAKPEGILVASQMEFREWMASYRKHVTNITVRFFVGDAVSFAHTLQHKHVTKTNTAWQYRDQFHLKPLILDGPNYASGIAPVAFDVIDASNLCDHFGSLILLSATSPLLRNHMSSILYADVLVKHHKTYKEVLDNMLCGHVPTLSALLGLFPVDYWTNTSSYSLGDEGMLEMGLGAFDKIDAVDLNLRQMFLRTCWRRPICMRSLSGPCLGVMRMQFDVEQLAGVLFQVYLHIFRDEDYILKFANVSFEALKESSQVWYHRASFALFLRLIKTRVTCDWNAVMLALISLIENRRNAPMGMNYIQELFVYLHLLDVYSCPVIKDWHLRNQMDASSSETFAPITPRIAPVDEKWGDLRDWENMPPVACITLKVPRKKLSVLTNTNDGNIGTPNVHGLLENARSSGRNSWQNLFPACQLTFGNVSTRGVPYDDSFAVSVAEDDLGWKGTSALVATFYVPSFFLLLEPQKAIVALGIHSTPATAMTFGPKLGPMLNIFETTLDDSANVYVTRYSPSQTGFPVAPGFAETELTAPGTVNLGADTSLIASIDQGTGNIVTHTGRLDITSDDYKSTLQNGCQVQISTLSPCQVTVRLGQALPLTVCFPVFVVEPIMKTRVARKSSYVEVVGQVGSSSEWMKYPYFMYPVYLEHGKPVNWNLPYLNLQKCPIIDTTLRNKLEWLTPHTSLAMSARERALRENKRSPRCSGEQIRLDFKESLFSLFIRFSGLQGQKHHVFGLDNEANGETNILILVSSLRLDLSNRAVVLDCAVLPLCPELLPKFRNFLRALTLGGLCHIKVNDAEQRLWKNVLPAFVERCRTWTHRADCEYAEAGRVPLTVEDERPFLCACGNGEFPPNFLNDVAHWNTVSRYAVRAAISPAWWAPFAESMYRPDTGGGGSAGVKSRPPSGQGCATCGKTERKDGAKLLNCARCMKVKYCSRECQRADWKTHKGACK